jgi:uncharacterized membrane protein required for colicin V production
MSIYGIFNNLDYFLIMIIVVLGVVSAIKGFFKEILGTLSLIIAFLVCFYYGSLLNIVMIKIVKIQIIANFLSYILLFLISMFILNHFLLKIFSNINMNKVLDILLGFTLGVLKAIVFIYICFASLDMVWIDTDQTQILQESAIKKSFYTIQEKLSIKGIYNYASD